jgi:prepilin-type N-terminal cleavage/methylation domain-containing protein
MKNSLGFTLIEVLIAMVILAFLTVSVVQTLRRGADFKTKIQHNIDERSTINSAMRMIERDINLAFHYQDVTTEVLNQLKTAGTKQTQTPTPPDPNNPNPPPPPTPPNPPTTPTNPYADIKIREIPNFTVFIGDKNDIHFTNLNNISTQGSQNFGDQEEVGYFIKSCKNLDGKTAGDCLWRRTSPVVDDDVTKGGDEMVLLENVKRFELRYFGKEKEDWVDHWHSDGKEEAALKDKFPQAVEVTLTLEKNKREVSAIRVIPLRFPNNKDPQQPAQQPGQPPPLGGSNP